MHTLVIEDLYVEIEDKKILKGFNLTVKSGEIHAIMGPNGTGKSTLSKVIMGDTRYKITKGKITYDGIDITNMPVDERARMGIFLGMQMPLEIEGVSNADFLRSAVHAVKNEDFKMMQFIRKLNANVEKLNMNKDMINRDINQGFSGGERKKNEILQMYMLEPSLVMLDEIDSGLDVDSLKIVGDNVMDYYNDKKPGMILVTHYQRLLDYVKPDFVHVMYEGKIIKTGDISLVDEIEKKGYLHIVENSNLNGSSAIEEKLENE